MLSKQSSAGPKRINGLGTACKTQRWDAFNWIEGTYIVGYGDRAKIGWSTNMGARFRQLQEGLPGPMRLYLWIETDCGKEIETGLHRRFKDLRVHREWFSLEGALKDFVAHNLDLYIDGTPATEDALKEAVWRQAVALWPDLASDKPEPLLDVPRQTGPSRRPHP